MPSSIKKDCRFFAPYCTLRGFLVLKFLFPHTYGFKDARSVSTEALKTLGQKWTKRSGKWKIIKTVIVKWDCKISMIAWTVILRCVYATTKLTLILKKVYKTTRYLLAEQHGTIYYILSANRPYLQPEGCIAKGSAQRDRLNAYERRLWQPPTAMNDPGAQQPSQMFFRLG